MTAKAVSSRVVALGLLVLLVPGCFLYTTKQEADELRAEITSMDARLDKQEESLAERTARLDESLGKAKQILGRSSADLGTEVQVMSQEIATLRGEVTGMRRELDQARTDINQVRADYEERLAAMEERLAALEAGISREDARAKLQADKGPMFDAAMRDYHGGRWAKARAGFDAYLTAFPSDARADDALFHLGQAYAKDGEYEKAIATYQRLIDVHARSDLADDAFFAAGRRRAADEVVHRRAGLLRRPRTALPALRPRGRRPSAPGAPQEERAQQARVRHVKHRVRAWARGFARWVLGPPLLVAGTAAIAFIPWVGVRLVASGFEAGRAGWVSLGGLVLALWVALFGATLVGFMRRGTRG